MSKVSGIYRITNKINKKMYIGLSVDIFDRWKDHIRELNKNQHINSYLQRSWNKYGEVNFNFEVIEPCDKHSLSEKEMSYIEKYDTYNNGYNLTKGGEGTLGRLHSKETREKISKANKGRVCLNSEQLKAINHTNKRKIIQLDLNGELINTWDSLLDICKHFDKNVRRTIKSCCDKEPKRLTSLGFIWMWKDEYDKIGIDMNEYSNNNAKNKNNLILCEEIKMKFKSIDEIVSYFEKDIGVCLNKRCIQNVISKKNRKYKGYTFLYLEMPSPPSL